MNTQDQPPAAGEAALRDLRQCVNFISRQSSATARRMSASGAKAISDIETELSRLRSVNAELLGALKNLRGAFATVQRDCDSWKAYRDAESVIKKAQEGSK